MPYSEYYRIETTSVWNTKFLELETEYDKYYRDEDYGNWNDRKHRQKAIIVELEMEYKNNIDIRTCEEVIVDIEKEQQSSNRKRVRGGE